MLTKSQVRAILDKTGVLQDGHFVLRGGWHATQGIFPMRVLQQPEYATSLASTLASAYRTPRPQVVLAGPGEGVLLGVALARAIHARLVYCHNAGGRWDVAPGQALMPEERVVICEDLLIDPADMLGRVELVKASGASLMGVAALFDLTPEGAELPWPLEALVRPELTIAHPANCALCQAGVPLSAPTAAIPV